MHKLRHYFLPHPETHKKAHLLHWHFLLIYVLIFVLLRSGVGLINTYKPGVLGVDSSVTVQQIIEGTNKERREKGLAPLRENQALSVAAEAKAKNMFEENYWAHFAPSGKDPWSFILRSGYKFSYAGENLARNFQTSEDIVKAWMYSPTHRDNILNSKYEDIGIAVVEGVLNGQKTTLVVQMLGAAYSPLAAAPPEVNLEGTKIEVEPAEVEKSRPVLVAGAQNSLTPPVGKSFLDPYVIFRAAGISLVSLIVLLLALDFAVLKRRGVFRLSSHHLAHMSLLALTGASLFVSQAGDIFAPIR